MKQDELLNVESKRRFLVKNTKLTGLISKITKNGFKAGSSPYCKAGRGIRKVSLKATTESEPLVLSTLKRVGEQRQGVYDI